MAEIQLKISSEGQTIALVWQLGMQSGWEVFGYNLVVELCRRPTSGALFTATPDFSSVVNPLHRMYLRRAALWQREFAKVVAGIPQGTLRLDIPLLHPLGNDLATVETRYRGTPHIGVVFLESAGLSAEGLAESRRYDRFIAGSTWNAELLKRLGLSDVHLVFQGIDPTLFHPAVKAAMFPDRFVVFSGGKLEYRKGQDIVVAAFKQFKTRHPEAFLLTNWQTKFLGYATDMELAGHVRASPPVEQGQLDISAWLAQNGIDPSDHAEVGLIPNYVMPQVVREADVALLPSRGEGGTNLVAMECMACGLPVILSANTGHLDLVEETRCYPLRSQGAAQSTSAFPYTEGWGESDVDEVVEQMEAVYQDREESSRRGAAAARFMEDWTWEKQVARLLDVCGRETGSPDAGTNDQSLPDAD